MKAIFISGLDFESPIQVGDHQLAKQFAKNGWDVAFISLVVTPFHLLSKNKNAIKRRLKNYFNQGYTYSIGEGNLWSYVPCGLITPKNALFSKLDFINSWHKYTIPNLEKFLYHKGFNKVDLLYIRDPYQQSILNFIDYDFSIYRIADNDEKFDTSLEDFRKLEKTLALKTNLVLYTAQNLKEKVIQLNPKNYSYLPNGVDIKHFQGAEHPVPKEYETINKPIVVYAGSLDFWFDYDLINKLSKSLPDIAFVIIGPNEKFRHNFEERENLYLFGPVDHKLIPKYLTHANLGIIPFNVQNYTELVDSINPIKLYEYMACGLPVVATQWDELSKLKSPATLCTNFEEFRTSILATLEKKPTEETMKSFARQFDWEHIYNNLLNNIQKIKNSES